MFVALTRMECHQFAYIVKVLENDFTLKVVESRPMSKSGVYSFLFQFVCVFFFSLPIRFFSFSLLLVKHMTWDFTYVTRTTHARQCGDGYSSREHTVIVFL